MYFACLPRIPLHEKTDTAAHLTCFQVLGIWPRYLSTHRFQVLPKDRNTNVTTIQAPFTK